MPTELPVRAPVADTRNRINWAFITLLGGAAAAWPLAPARAQGAGDLPRVAVLSPDPATAGSVPLPAFLGTLGKLGYVDGRNIRLDIRFAENRRFRPDAKAVPAPSSPSAGTRPGENAPAAPNRSPLQTRARLKPDGGVFVVPVQINGAVTLDFTIDSGAAAVSVTPDVFSRLKREGTIKDTDITGQQTYILADGSKKQWQTFTIRSLRVGDVVVENVKGVISSQGAKDLLLGQSFLRHFKSWSIDNTTHELLLGPAPPAPNPSAPPQTVEAPNPAAPPQTVEVSRVMVVGQKLRLDFAYSLNVDCSSLGPPTVRIVEPAQHGNFATEQGTGYTSFAQDNPRWACNKRQSDGTIVSYEPNGDFTGTDTVGVEIIYPSGRSAKRHYSITVSPAADAFVAPPNPPKMREFSHVAAAGQVFHFTFLYHLTPDCSSLGFASVRPIEEPKHGKMTVENGTGFSTFPQSNVRFECNNRRTDGVIVSYTPEQRFVGADSITLDVIYADGTYDRRHYAIEVK